MKLKMYLALLAMGMLSRKVATMMMTIFQTLKFLKPYAMHSTAVSPTPLI